METIEKEVKTFLTKLGSGPNKIAESLAEMKIRGIIGDGNQCAITKALRKNFKNLKNLSVSTNIEFTYKNEGHSMAYPAAVSKFIEKFDKGGYPNLATKTSLAEVLAVV